jgi:hypothetical protein
MLCITTIICGMKTVKQCQITRTQSLDGEIHFIIAELKLNDAPSGKCNLDETQIKEMRKEAQKPLLIKRE